MTRALNEEPFLIGEVFVGGNGLMWARGQGSKYNRPIGYILTTDPADIHRQRKILSHIGSEVIGGRVPVLA